MEDELTICNVRVSIKLDKFSNNLSPRVEKAITTYQSVLLEKKFKFFVPEIYRSSEINDISNRSESIATLTTELEDWVIEWYGSFMNPAYGKELVQHIISYATRLCPVYSITSSKFRIMCLTFIVGFFLDDCADENNTDDEAAAEKRLKYFDMLSSPFIKGCEDKLAGFDLSNLEIAAINLPLFAEQPHLIIIADSLREILELIIDLHPDSTYDSIISSVKFDWIHFFQCWKWSCIHAPKGSVEDYSVDTYRYFQSSQTLFPFYVSFIALLENMQFPTMLKTNPIFIQWSSLGNKMTGMMNDLFGFQKDLIKGEEDGVIFAKLRKGISLDDAVDQELQLLQEYTEDYKKLRALLLKEFGEQQNDLLSYIQFADAALYGQLHVFKDSARCGMKDQIEIE